jgi:hypothetical protein
MNVKLLRKVKEHILAEPKRLLMDDWIAFASGRKRKTFINDVCKREHFAKCGTAACIAGWVCLLADGKQPDQSVSSRAIDLLEIGDYQGSYLFFTNLWPNGLGAAYYAAESASKRAEIAAQRIEHFIKTKGAE